IERRDGRWFASAGPDVAVLGLCDAGEGTFRDNGVEGELGLTQGESALFSLAGAAREPAVIPGRADSERRLERTMRFWPEWAGRSAYDGVWSDAVTRSALALKLLTFAPSGAIVAAPTTSLPEWIGGRRNWDYRFTWLRDASWTLDAMLRLGYHDEAPAFFWGLMHAPRLTPPRPQIPSRAPGPGHPEGREAGPDRQRRARPGTARRLRQRARGDRALRHGCRAARRRHRQGGRADRRLRGRALARPRQRHLGGARRAGALHPVQGALLGR